MDSYDIDNFLQILSACSIQYKFKATFKYRFEILHILINILRYYILKFNFASASFNCLLMV